MLRILLFWDPKHITVYSDAAEDLGYQDMVDQETAVSALDVLAAMHKEKISFNRLLLQQTNYLEIMVSGIVNCWWCLDRQDVWRRDQDL